MTTPTASQKQELVDRLCASLDQDPSLRESYEECLQNLRAGVVRQRLNPELCSDHAPLEENEAKIECLEIALYGGQAPIDEGYETDTEEESHETDTGEESYETDTEWESYESDTEEESYETDTEYSGSEETTEDEGGWTDVEEAGETTEEEEDPPVHEIARQVRQDVEEEEGVDTSSSEEAESDTGSTTSSCGGGTTSDTEEETTTYSFSDTEEEEEENPVVVCPNHDNDTCSSDPADWCCHFVAPEPPVDRGSWWPLKSVANDPVGTGDTFNNSAAVTMSGLSLASETSGAASSVQAVAQSGTTAATVFGAFGCVGSVLGIGFGAFGTYVGAKNYNSASRENRHLHELDQEDSAEKAAAEQTLAQLNQHYVDDLDWLLWFAINQKALKCARSAMTGIWAAGSTAIGVGSLGVGIAALAGASVATAGLALAAAGLVIAVAGIGLIGYKAFKKWRKRRSKKKRAKKHAAKLQRCRDNDNPEADTAMQRLFPGESPVALNNKTRSQIKDALLGYELSKRERAAKALQELFFAENPTGGPNARVVHRDPPGDGEPPEAFSTTIIRALGISKPDSLRAMSPSDATKKLINALSGW